MTRTERLRWMMILLALTGENFVTIQALAARLTWSAKRTDFELTLMIKSGLVRSELASLSSQVKVARTQRGITWFNSELQRMQRNDTGR